MCLEYYEILPFKQDVYMQNHLKLKKIAVL